MTLTPGEDQHGDLSLTLGVSQQLQRKQSHIQLNLENPRGQRISTGGDMTGLSLGAPGGGNLE